MLPTRFKSCGIGDKETKKVVQCSKSTCLGYVHSYSWQYHDWALMVHKQEEVKYTTRWTSHSIVLLYWISAQLRSLFSTQPAASLIYLMSIWKEAHRKRKRRMPFKKENLTANSKQANQISSWLLERAGDSTRFSTGASDTSHLWCTAVINSTKPVKV